MKYYYHSREASPNCPAGFTVSKHAKLPDGDFVITEYSWRTHGYCDLWFVDQDDFTADERHEAYLGFVGMI